MVQVIVVKTIPNKSSAMIKLIVVVCFVIFG